MSVCPAGEDVIGAYKVNRAGFLNGVVKPLTGKVGVWLPWALLRGGVRIKGDPRLLFAFGRCFPG